VSFGESGLVRFLLNLSCVYTSITWLFRRKIMDIGTTRYSNW